MEEFGQDGQEGVADQREVDREIAVPGAGAVFSYEGIAAPVVTIFDSGPAALDPPEPLLGRMLLGQCAGEGVAGFDSAVFGLGSVKGGVVWVFSHCWA